MLYNGWHKQHESKCKGTSVTQKNIFTNELEQRQLLDNEPFLLKDMARRTTKDDRPFILCTLADKCGTISGVFWDIPPHVDEWVRPGVAVLVTGKVTRYQDSLQVNITDLNRWLDPDMGLFLPTSQRPRTEMEAELKAFIAGLATPWQPLVERVMLDPELYPRIVAAPAARSMHHAYLGGLLEHTLSMAALSQEVSRHYRYVNSDLLLAGVLLHDVGKALEYQVDGEFTFSTDGRLVGHIVRGITLVEKAATELGNIPPEAVQELVHLIAAHHGTREWGSPVVPKTLEAVLLHQLDLMDSRVQGFLDHFQEEGDDGEWSTRQSAMFRTEIRRPAGWLVNDDPD